MVILSAGTNGVGEIAINYISELVVFFGDPVLLLFLGCFCIQTFVDLVERESKNLDRFLFREVVEGGRSYNLIVEFPNYAPIGD